MKRILIAASMLGACGLLAQNQVTRLNSGELKNEVGIEFVQIQPGDFMMGCSTGDIDCNADEKPVHRVQSPNRFRSANTKSPRRNGRASWKRIPAQSKATIIRSKRST